jgi:hypothetical protein
MVDTGFRCGANGWLTGWSQGLDAMNRSILLVAAVVGASAQIQRMLISSSLRLSGMIFAVPRP